MKKILPLKQFGQNFLKDKNISKKIVDLLENDSDRNVIEIGPGMGALTEILLSQNRKIITVEKDTRALKYLQEKFKKSNNLTMIEGDILDVDLSTYGNNENKIDIIGNIPYNITNAILFWLFKNYTVINRVVMTIQKEVALRYIAKPQTKDYGITTLAVDMYATIKKMFDVSANCFEPKPKVTSAVILIDFNKKIPENNEQLMKLIRISFSNRRKILSNSLKNYLNHKNIDIRTLENHLKEMNYNYLKQRAEELSLTDYSKLLHCIDEICQKCL